MSNLVLFTRKWRCVDIAYVLHMFCPHTLLFSVLVRITRNLSVRFCCSCTFRRCKGCILWINFHDNYSQTNSRPEEEDKLEQPEEARRKRRNFPQSGMSKRHVC